MSTSNKLPLKVQLKEKCIQINPGANGFPQGG